MVVSPVNRTIIYNTCTCIYINAGIVVCDSFFNDELFLMFLPLQNFHTGPITIKWSKFAIIQNSQHMTFELVMHLIIQNKVKLPLPQDKGTQTDVISIKFTSIKTE